MQLNGLFRVTAPASPLISLEEARMQCRVDAWGSPPQHPEDALIEQYVQAAIDELDGIDGWLNRALVTQTWRLHLSAFPEGRIRLPLPPLQSVTSVAYDAPDGSVATMDSADYIVQTETDPGSIRPVSSWPTLGTDGEVRITFVAGYGDPADVPEIIRQYVRHRVGQYYDHRSLIRAGVGAGQAHEVPHIRNSLESIRMRGVWP